MKKILLISAASLAFAVPAFAGLDITWDGCATGPGLHPSDKALACAEGDVNELYGVFQSPATLTNFTAIDCFIDLQVDAPALTPFWTFQTAISAGCNTQMAISDVRPASSACSATNPWGTGGGSGDNAIGYVPGQGGANRGRFVTTSFRNATPLTTVTGGVSYYAWHIILASDAEAVDGCTGCSTPVAIVWNQANVSSATAQNASEAVVTVITNPGIVSNCATGSGGGACGATPVKNKTWGALKSLYR